MRRECCAECGHLLYKDRSGCPFCGRDGNSDKYRYSLKIENDRLYHDPHEYRIDQLPGL